MMRVNLLRLLVMSSATLLVSLADEVKQKFGKCAPQTLLNLFDGPKKKTTNLQVYRYVQPKERPREPLVSSSPAFFFLADKKQGEEEAEGTRPGIGNRNYSGNITAQSSNSTKNPTKANNSTITSSNRYYTYFTTTTTTTVATTTTARSCSTHNSSSRSSSSRKSIRRGTILCNVERGRLIQPAFLLPPWLTLTHNHPLHLKSARVCSKRMASEEEQKAATAQNSGEDTIFGKIVRGEIPCKKVYEDEKCLAFHDVNPQAPIHIILIPKNTEGLTRLSTASERHKEILGHLMWAVSHIAAQERIGDFRLVINDGPKGCQSVYHLHLHILGGRQMQWPPG